MPTYTPPLRDFRFVLHETLKIHEQTDIDGFADLTDDLTGAILEEAGKLASEVLRPVNAIGDTQGCRLENGVVRTPEGFRQAMDALRDGGWPGLECDPEDGGQGMPSVIAAAVGEMHTAANMALIMYTGLTHGTYSALRAHGSEELKRTYLPKLATAEWTGTMNLTEPHCGTDLGLLRTKAEPQADGSYRITGQKIFISAGDHDMAENIIHLVLARIAGAPAGVKGISLFLAPKYLVNQDGSLGAANGVTCGKIEEKMGIHGNATCVLNYDGAKAWLVGEREKGLRAMFTMMNEARLSVAAQGLSQAVAAYQSAADYARERLQGRAVSGPEAEDQPADPIIAHPDVRRALLDQKAFIEGARAFMLWGASQYDIERRHADPKRRAEAAGLLALLTPVLKAFLTDKGYECSSQALQVFGGHGYIEETGMSQFVRDARITMIYEGTNGVQALDLVGRKLALDGGKPIMGLFERIKTFLRDAAKSAEGEDAETLARDFLEPLKRASKDMQQAAMHFMAHGVKNPNEAVAGSTDFLHMFGHVCCGYMWARMAVAARAALRDGAADPDFYRNKLATGRYYMSKLLPETGLRLARVLAGAEAVMALPAEAF